MHPSTFKGAPIPRMARAAGTPILPLALIPFLAWPERQAHLFASCSQSSWHTFSASLKCRVTLCCRAARLCTHGSRVKALSFQYPTMAGLGSCFCSVGAAIYSISGAANKGVGGPGRPAP
eukprot:scaffold90825_cov15-Tisochrysis_lutea.AAC.1